MTSLCEKMWINF